MVVRPLTFGFDYLLMIGGCQVDEVHSIVPGFGHGPLSLLEAKIARQSKPWEGTASNRSTRKRT